MNGTLIYDNAILSYVQIIKRFFLCFFVFFCFCFLDFGFMYGFHLVESWPRSYDAHPLFIIRRERKRKKKEDSFVAGHK
jgi:hypothetical protein